MTPVAKYESCKAVVVSGRSMWKCIAPAHGNDNKHYYIAANARAHTR